ncbi:MAG: response regulator transcription factor [Gammaproteobacteria bacterium]|nr:response regulator transcription factor [Gammaproteobacteria bacterium]MDH3768009.1 response regulator transcription factor [Gammaproteobacteria bacterium]
MTERTLLWIDLTLQESRTPATRYFDEFFTIRKNSHGSLTDTEADRPDALCIDYDFPDRPGLEFLEETKRRHPSIPILMLTLQHSEELAVWAFRARVWDYFAKPIERRDVERCYEALCKIDLMRSGRRSVRTNPPVPAQNRLRRHDSGDQRALAPAIAYVQSHYSEKIAQTEVAKLCGMSTFRFSRVFHAAFGQTFQDYLLRLRVEQAVELLRNPTVGVSDVAYAVGFRDASYFGRVFRKAHNMSPTQWRQHQLDEARPQLQLSAPPPRS